MVPQAEGQARGEDGQEQSSVEADGMELGDVRRTDGGGRTG